MEVLVVYDVDTVKAAGRKRLRRVAKVCEGYGQRVQDSVFECTLSEEQMERLRTRLVEIIDAEQDSLRIYRLMQPRERMVEELGRRLANDLHDPLVL
ncbi:MAG: CRISPR-associated endonuclease Cas2 [Chloroflexota bacterium]|jgi:CRISPR-associated protein Cas2|nr:CRISPR-associated endonuclease Cas2 [Chloroflexota bacterium]